MQDINIKITDRNGATHDVVAPTDMAMNLMEIVRSYELAEEGTIGICGGMAMCASCQCYVTSDHKLHEKLLLTLHPHHLIFQVNYDLMLHNIGKKHTLPFRHKYQ